MDFQYQMKLNFQLNHTILDHNFLFFNLVVLQSIDAHSAPLIKYVPPAFIVPVNGKISQDNLSVVELYLVLSIYCNEIFASAKFMSLFVKFYNSIKI